MCAYQMFPNYILHASGVRLSIINTQSKKTKRAKPIKQILRAAKLK